VAVPENNLARACPAILVALFARFLCQSPQLFRLIPGSLRWHVFFRKPTVPLGILTAVVGIRAPALCLLASPLRRTVVVWHAVSFVTWRQRISDAGPKRDIETVVRRRRGSAFGTV
jgi:hypothetical protein